MSDLEQNINQMEELYLNDKTPNIDIIRNHSLEILLSLSENLEFIQIINSK